MAGETTRTEWTIDDVERLGKFMATSGITLVELPGLKLMRHPQESFYGAIGKEAEKVKGAAEPTDEEILMNPMAGLEF